jgi:hypothetical protein
VSENPGKTRARGSSTHVARSARFILIETRYDIAITPRIAPFSRADFARAMLIKSRRADVQTGSFHRGGLP